MIADKRRGNLHIEQIGGGQTRGEPADPNFFSPGVDDNLPLRIVEELPEWLQVATPQRIDEIQPLSGGNLDQAKFRPEGILADKFGVKSDFGTVPEMIEAFGQQRWMINNPFRHSGWLKRSAGHSSLVKSTGQKRSSDRGSTSSFTVFLS
jgi:hypothetical protein